MTATAITRLYDVLALVPRPAAIDYCGCCFTPDEERALLADVPLRRLSVEALRPYAANVIFTVGGPADFRHFLPRILEIACTEGFGWPDLEPLLSRLRYAGWHQWQPEEHAAVRAFLTAVWEEALTGDGEDPDIALCAIGNAEDDLTPYLSARASHIAAPETRTAASAELRDLLTHGCRTDRGVRRLANAFWQDRSEQEQQVLAWLTGAELVRAVFDGDDAEALTDLAQLL